MCIKLVSLKHPNDSVFIFFTIINNVQCLFCDLDLWPPTLKNNRFLHLVIRSVPSLTVIRFGPIFFYRVEPDNAKQHPAHPTFVNDLDLWPMTLKINMVHSVIIGNRCAYFYKNTMNSLILIMFTRLFPFVNYDVDLWPPNSIASIYSHHSSHVCQVWWRWMRHLN